MAEWVPPSSRVGIDFAEPGMATMRRKFEEPVSSQYIMSYTSMQEPVLYFFKKKASTNPDLEKSHSHSPNTP